MSENVIQLPVNQKKHRVQYKGFAKIFKRVEVRRELEPVREGELHLYPTLASPSWEWYTARYLGPGENYREAKAFPLRDFKLGPELLIYRVLRDLYGVADFVTVAFPAGFEAAGRQLRDGEFPHIAEWAFMLQGKSQVMFEIRRQAGTQEPHLALWLPVLRPAAALAGKALPDETRLFVEELRKTLEASRALVNRNSINSQSVSLGPLNVYGDMIDAGNEQLAAAEAMKPAYRKLPARPVNKLSTPASLGTFYLAAAIQFLLALEAYVNLLSELLRKREFRDELFERATTRADFEMRLLSLALYCDGFAKAPFSPETALFKRIRMLRNFRNNILHGNLSHDDHVLQVVPDDHFYFHWWPAVDEYSKRDGDSIDRLPLARVLFTRRHADSVRQTVELAVDAIIDAMEPSHRAWATKWRRNRLVPAYFKDQEWHPTVRTEST
jgi:hypothetical protein